MSFTSSSVGRGRYCVEAVPPAESWPTRCSPQIPRNFKRALTARAQPHSTRNGHQYQPTKRRPVGQSRPTEFPPRWKVNSQPAGHSRLSVPRFVPTGPTGNAVPIFPIPINWQTQLTSLASQSMWLPTQEWVPSQITLTTRVATSMSLSWCGPHQRGFAPS